MITPFYKNEIDFLALERIIEHVITNGIDYIVALGTTGEATTLSSKECRAVLDFTISTVANRVPIVAGGFGSNNTQELVEKIQTFDFDGIDAILSNSPAYNKPSQEGIFQHYTKVAEVSPLPIILYNVPGRTASNMTSETISRLAHSNPKFIGIKEASGDILQSSKIIKQTPDDFLMISGDDPTALALTACGGDGVISVIANAYPKEWTDMIQATLEGKRSVAQALNNLLLDLHHWLYIEGNPAGIKAACAELKLCMPDLRLPLVPLSAANMPHLLAEINNIQLLKEKKKPAFRYAKS